MAEPDASLAVFIDFENLALGFHNRRDRFDIIRVLERLVEKGKIVVKKAYADWNRFAPYTQSLHEAAIELIEIPKRAQTGKNSADIRLCVDAIDMAYAKEHITTFVIVSGAMRTELVITSFAVITNGVPLPSWHEPRLNPNAYNSGRCPTGKVAHF